MTDTVIRDLQALAEDLDWPQAPDLPERVVVAVREPQIRAERPSVRWLAVAAAVATITVTLLAWAPAREAAADLLGVFGIRIEEAPDLADATFELDLGTPVTLESAAKAVGYEPALPTALPQPDQVFLPDAPPGHLMAVWAAGPNLPDVGGTGVGALLSQFPADEETAAILKRLTPTTEVVPVVVGGAPGFWLEGGPHVVSFADSEGRTVADSTRLAGNVLIWNRDGITYRLELAVDVDRALMLAMTIE